MQIAGAAGAVAASALGVWEAAHGREHPAPIPHGQWLGVGWTWQGLPATGNWEQKVIFLALFQMCLAWSSIT